MLVPHARNMDLRYTHVALRTHTRTRARVPLRLCLIVSRSLVITFDAGGHGQNTWPR